MDACAFRSTTLRTPSRHLFEVYFPCRRLTSARHLTHQRKPLAFGGELHMSFVSCCRRKWLNLRFKSRTSSGCDSTTASPALSICRTARRSAAFSPHGLARTSGGQHTSWPIAARLGDTMTTPPLQPGATKEVPRELSLQHAQVSATLGVGSSDRRRFPMAQRGGGVVRQFAQRAGHRDRASAGA